MNLFLFVFLFTSLLVDLGALPWSAFECVLYEYCVKM